MNNVNLYQNSTYLYRESTNLCRNVKNLYRESINLPKWKLAVRVQANACTSEGDFGLNKYMQTKTAESVYILFIIICLNA